ncbi:MAG: PKD domain-containing protein [Bacteroidota bacterium]
MKRLVYKVPAMIAMVAIISSCSEDPPLVDLFFEADAEELHTIHFTTISENATAFTWDFGDNETGSGSEISHTYATSGAYTVTVTATGEGGEATASKEVKIASEEEMLSGGPDETNGKTWVLSRTATAGVDGVGSVDSTFRTNLMPGTDDMLVVIGLGEEYDNEYTFFHDGSYSVDNFNGNNLAGWVYSYGNFAEEDIVKTTSVGIFTVKNSPSGNATWSMTKDADMVVEALEENPIDGTITPRTTTFTDIDYLTFGNGGFIGFQDYSVIAIIRDITPDRMVLTLFLHSVWSIPEKPSHLITLSFDAK